MSKPNLNLDFDPLEGPSTRVWKAKPKEFGGRRLEDVADYVNNFMDNVFGMSFKKNAAEAVCRKEPTIPENGSESKRKEASSDEDDVNENSPPGKFRSMKINRESLNVIRSLARELGSRMPLEQQWACGSLFNMAMSRGLFSGKPDEDKMDQLQQLMSEIAEKMPTDHRMAFGMLCQTAMKRFREQAELQNEKLPVEKEYVELALD